MSTLTNLGQAEVERRPIRKIPAGHWLGCFPQYTDEQLIRPNGHK